MNLFSGLAAVYFALHDGNILLGAKLIFLGAFFDFFDGFVARLIKATSAIGKELDSLSDLVTFGLAPAALIASAYNMLWWQLVMVAFIPLMSALRLAKFNLDNNQKYEFIGLPTPALAITVASFVLSGVYTDFDPIMVSVFAMILALLLVSPLKMLSLKFRDGFSFTANKHIYVFLVTVLMLVFVFGYRGVLYSMLLYFLLSILRNLKARNF